MRILIILLLCLVPSLAYGNVEYDYLPPTFIEEDENTEVTVAAGSLTMAALDHDSTTYVYTDSGAGYWSGDFTFRVAMIAQAGTTNNSSINSWAVANVIKDENAMRTANDPYLGVQFYQDGAGDLFIYVLEHDSDGSIYSDGYQGAVIGTTYYVEITRDESQCTYGKLTVDIYTTSDYSTTKVDTLLPNTDGCLHTSKKDYQYLYGLLGFDDGSSGVILNGVFSGLTLVEAAAAASAFGGVGIGLSIGAGF